MRDMSLGQRRERLARISVALNDKADEAIERLAKKERTTKADILRRALALYNYVQQETEGEGKKLSLTNRDGEVEKDIVLT